MGIITSQQPGDVDSYDMAVGCYTFVGNGESHEKTRCATLTLGGNFSVDHP